jgi:hypothetical protein
VPVGFPTAGLYRAIPITGNQNTEPGDTRDDLQCLVHAHSIEGFRFVSGCGRIGMVSTDVDALTGLGLFGK